MNKVKQIFKKAIVENPIFALFLGLCPVLAVSNSFDAAFGMSLAVIVVLIMTNMIISAIRKIVPNEIRIPVYIIIIATVVTVVKMLMSAFMATVFNSLGVYLSLIVVNCIILGRAESFASKNGVIDSIFDALGMGVGYLFAVLVMSFFRELIGTGGVSLLNPFDTTQVIFDIKIFADYAVSLFTQPAGAFITLGCILAFIQLLSVRKANKAKEAAKKEGGK